MENLQRKHIRALFRILPREWGCLEYLPTCEGPLQIFVNRNAQFMLHFAGVGLKNLLRSRTKTTVNMANAPLCRYEVLFPAG